MCNAICTRRSSECPHFPFSLEEGIPTVNGIQLASLYQCYAEMAASIGCKCVCCRDSCNFLEFEDYHLLNADRSAERSLLRAALSAAGSPDCELADVLASYDAS